MVPPRSVERVEVVDPFQRVVVARSRIARAGGVGVVLHVVVARHARHGRGVPCPGPVQVLHGPKVHEYPHRMHELSDVLVGEKGGNLSIDEPSHDVGFPLNGIVDHGGVRIERGGHDVGDACEVGMMRGELDGVVQVAVISMSISFTAAGQL